jgi:phosphoribosylformimino-5-aminoimidazole carboxamide ribotide isomerase
MRLIIAMDIIDGRCVRLTKGDYSTKKIYNEDPLEVARKIEDHGFRFLHLVDLDGARNKKTENLGILEKIASSTDLYIDFGGGLRTKEDLKSIFNAGAEQVTGGSIAVSDPGMFLEWLSDYGSDRIILGADAVNRRVAIGGWADKTDIDVIEFISGYRSKGVKYTICTDIEKDGMLAGPSTGLYADILQSVDINIIASGGVSSVEDIRELALAGCEGVIIGKAIYEGSITLEKLSGLC